MDKAVVLMSGGVNSAVTAAVAREQYEPAWLHFAWGHRAAERELCAYEQLATHWRIEEKLVVGLGFLATMGGSSRIGKRQMIEDANALGRQTPSTFMAGLIPTMLSIATTWAGTIGARRIMIGLSEDHGVSGPAVSQLYPDHRHEFVQAFNLMLDQAHPVDQQVLVEAPLMELNRMEVVRLGEKLKVPFEKTWSCYGGNEIPCGRCRACVTRTVGFLKASIPDPLLSVAALAATK